MTLRSTGRWFWASDAEGDRGGPSGRRGGALAMMVVFAAVMGCAGAFAAYRALTGDVDAYLASHRQITAQVLSLGDRTSAAARRAGTSAEVAWVDGSGIGHTGMTRLRGDQVEKARVRIWVDADARPAAPPMGGSGVVLGSLITGLVAGAAGWSVALLARSGRRAWTARRAMAGWDREWRAHADADS
ncbi:hypothetical protein [Streptosporangium roseum]|uniref:hypothetical protein n=1 Tax=Streptosporangium roseum TaxID=2001 RepID=UPI0033199E2B